MRAAYNVVSASCADRVEPQVHANSMLGHLLHPYFTLADFEKTGVKTFGVHVQNNREKSLNLDTNCRAI